MENQVNDAKPPLSRFQDVLPLLPQSPPGKVGWPWQPNSCSGATWDKNSYLPPRISIVTPSYNQGAFLEQTLRSVLLQGYPNLEYIVIDGGSDDESIQILEKYQQWLSYWHSACDHGQADALNQGFARATGSLAAWINSDDILLPGALWTLAAIHAEHPEAMLHGDVINLHADQGQVWRITPKNVSFDALREHWRHPVTWHQPGTFFPLSLLQQIGPLDTTISNLFDLDFMCRALRVSSVIYCSYPVAAFRYHHQSKTLNDPSRWIREKQSVVQRYWPESIAKSPTLSKAALHMVAADTELALHWRNPGQGTHWLVRAAAADLRVACWRRYWLLWLKVILPIRVLQSLRKIRKSF
jgi:GT2 family glycosyltransferase